jgi:hypothetical protein
MTTWSPDMRHRLFATRVLCDVANEHGVTTREVLTGTGITPTEFDDPDALVTAWDEVVSVRRLLERLPEDPGVGIEVGSRFTLTHLGLFGFAVMSCGTLRELFTVAMRYFALTMLHIDVALFEGADDCTLELNADHLPADVRRFFIERDMAGIIATTTGFALPVVAKYADQVSAEVAIDEDVLRPLLELIPFENVAFGRAHNRLHFPRAMLDEPLPQADPHTLEICIAQCDVLMQRSEQRRGITAVVRTKLFRDSGGLPALAEIAAESTCIRARCGAGWPKRGRRFGRCSTRRARHWRSICSATSGSPSRRCPNGWATPIRRRSPTRSNAGTAPPPAPTRPSAVPLSAPPARDWPPRRRVPRARR